METNLPYTEEQYNDFDLILSSGIYYLQSISKGNDSLTILNFNTKSEYDLVLYELATLYCSITNKQLYLEMPLFKYLWFKYKHKTSFKRIVHIPDNTCCLDSVQTMCNICVNVNLPHTLIPDIYTAYYKKG